MNLKIKLETPEDIVKNLCIGNGIFLYTLTQERLREEMKNLLKCVKESLPNKKQNHLGWTVTKHLDHAFRDGQSEGYNNAVEDCKLVIEKLYNSL